MASLRISGDVSGTVEVQAPAASGSTKVILPTANGTILAPAAVTVPGALLIGNTVSGGFDTAALTVGPGLIQANSNGSITLSVPMGQFLALYNGFAMP